jgi:alanine-synthesizing transaminase
MEFRRIERFPPYVFSIVNDLKMQARPAGKDVVDLGMGNPDLPTRSRSWPSSKEVADNPRTATRRRGHPEAATTSAT